MRRKLLNLCMIALFSVFTTAAWALSEVGGVYQIGTAEDLLAFAELVNGGQVNANAVLTADIDKGSDGTMIGTSANMYSGFFDGKGHTIKINIIAEATYAGLFQYTGGSAVIQNLKVEGTITTANKFAGGLVGRNRGVIRGCYIDVTIDSEVAGDGTHGGVAAVTNRGALIEDCLVKTSILGENTICCGGVVGWAEERTNIVNCLVINDGSTFDSSDKGASGHSSNLSRAESNTKAVNLETYIEDPYGNRPGGACYNNYVTVDWGGTNPATTVVPYEDLADGRICYQLNNDQSRIAWVQNIGTDEFPVPAAFGTGQVYASDVTGCDGKSEGELTFSNTGSDQAAKHSFDKYGVCTTCGCFNFNAFDFDNPARFDQAERAILLGSVADIDLAEGWNRVANGLALNMKLTKDLTYEAETGEYIFNTSDLVVGNFNGDGHTLTIEMSNLGANAALFPNMGGNVENLYLTGTIGTTGNFVGSVAGEARMALVRNVYSDVTINNDRGDDHSSGGFFGRINNPLTVENCIYAGDYNTPRDASSGEGCVRIGGFSGWSNATTYFNNCAVLGHLNGAGGAGNIENSKNITRGTAPNTSNCYVANPIYGPDIDDHALFTIIEDPEDIESGKLTFELNGKKNAVERFYQVIGTDLTPMPIKKEGGLVYAVAAEFMCNGTPVGAAYQNSPAGDPVIPPHNFVDGFCINVVGHNDEGQPIICGAADESFSMTPVDGWYEIGTPSQLIWWAKHSSEYPAGKARLTADIDMLVGDVNLSQAFTTAYLSTPFTGEFDGQGHTFSHLNIVGGNYAGLIGLVGSGAVVKNFIFDETCSITGAAFVGIIGCTNGSGDIYITNIGNEGRVTGSAQNVCAIIGCCSGGSMAMHISNCYVTSEITAARESAAICGYSGAASEVVNCWAKFTINESGIYRSDSFTRGSAKVINCYEADLPDVATDKQQHYNPMAADRLTITLPLEDIESGRLCFNLNGKQFKDPVWYQTLEEDAHPYPFDNHGVVIAAGEEIFSIPNDDLGSVASAIQTAEKEAAAEIDLATQSLLDALDAAIESLTDAETFEDFSVAYDAVTEAKAAVVESAAAYEAYITKCEEVRVYLEEHTDFAGDVRTALEAYLSDDVTEPDDVNTLGSYEYVVDVHTATTEEIVAETKRVEDWLAEAIKTGYLAGSDVSNLLVNSDFSKGNEGWTGGFGNGFGETVNDEGKTFVGVEAWSVTGDQYQSVEGLKPGYYLIGVNAAFRPSNNRYSTNYAAGIYANGIFNYFPAAIEDPVYLAEAVDGVNCNLTIKSAYDFNIYEDGESTSGADSIGFIVQGETGMAIAAKAGRYQAYTIAKVGEDGKLTVGIKNPGTKYSNDWTGWGPITMTYYGEADAVVPALITALDNMAARANSIISYEHNSQNAPSAPNFPAALKADLKTAVAAYNAEKAAETPSIEKLQELAETFSTLFQAIYEGKQAYVQFHKTIDMIEAVASFNMNLATKDETTGQWVKNDAEFVFSEDEKNAILDANDELLEKYESGSLSTEEALNPALDPALADLIPAQDEDGYYLIGTTKQFVAFHTIASEVDRYAKGKLTADVDMAGVTMLPIGHNRGENAQHIFAGVFDGQGHALTNVWIDDLNIPSGEYAEPATLFYELQNATVKNFRLTGVFHTTHSFSGPLSRWLSGTTTIDNCEIETTLYLAAGLAGDASSGGLIGRNGSANSLINNCLVNTQLIGEGENPISYVGGIAGWADASLKIQNTLILSTYQNVGRDGDNSRTISRGTKATPTNVYVSQHFREAEGTLVSADQLLSGEVAWKLNGETGENAHWFQEPGVDPTPHLFEGPVVYYYGGQYITEKPNPQLNAFAYNLEAGLGGDNVTIYFDLNAEAEAAEVQFVKGEELVYTQPVTEELTAGSYSVTVPISELGGNDPKELNFKISVTGKGSLDVLRAGDVYKVWGPYGLAVNNNPESKNFGQVLIAEAYPTESTNPIYISCNKTGAIFAFDQNFKPINSADGTPGFYGGVPNAGQEPLVIAGGYKFDFKDLQFTEDGRLFVARASGKCNSSVWEIDPEDYDKPWTPVFTGGELDEATGITYVGDEEQNRPALSIAFNGKGEDLKMYVLGGQRSNGQYNVTDYNCSIYNLGTAKEWTTAPSANFEPLDGKYTYGPYRVGIHGDGQGGLWFIQSLGTGTLSAEYPALKHFDAQGNEDYSNYGKELSGGRIAVSPDGNYIAMPNGNGSIVLYETNYIPGETGRISLNVVNTYNVKETAISCLAFDWANNLYVASTGSETFSRYTVPTANKVVVTPGNGIGIAGDVNNDGTVDAADAEAVLTAIASEGYYKYLDFNRDGKVDAADLEFILSIIAGQ